MYERFTDRARKSMMLANQEAQRWDHDHVDTAHVLLGVLREGSGIAVTLLAERGVSQDKVRGVLAKELTPGPETVVKGRLPQTTAAREVIEQAIAAADELGNSWVGTEHLLLGLLREGKGAAAWALGQLGVTLEMVRQDVVAFQAEPRARGSGPGRVEDLCGALHAGVVHAMHFRGVSREEAASAALMLCRLLVGSGPFVLGETKGAVVIPAPFYVHGPMKTGAAAGHHWVSHPADSE